MDGPSRMLVDGHLDGRQMAVKGSETKGKMCRITENKRNIIALCKQLRDSLIGTVRPEPCCCNAINRGSAALGVPIEKSDPQAALISQSAVSQLA